MELNDCIFDSLLNFINQQNYADSEVLLLIKSMEHNHFKKNRNEMMALLEESAVLSRNNIEHLAATQTSNNYRLINILQSQQQHIEYLELKLNKLLDERNAASSDKKKRDHQKIEEYIQVIKTETLQKRMIERERLKVAMFTPLKPLKTGIADYTEDMLIALNKYFDFDIFIEDNYEPTNEQIKNLFQIYHHEEFKTKYAEYDTVIYQLGNNQFHLYMIPYMLIYSGIIVLHEFNLNYLYRLLPEDYRRTADENSLSAAYPSLDPQVNPFNKYLLDKAVGIIVHNQYTKNKILEQDFTRHVKKIDLYSHTESAFHPEYIQGLRKKYHLENAFIFASFGFVTWPKRVAQALQAFSRLINENPETRFVYLIVGQVDDDRVDELNYVMEKCQLQDHVVITGYTTLEQFQEYIAVSDICVNLRNPYGGESSGTVARIMGLGKACIVNDIGSFGEIPDGCCLKIPNDQNEINNIYNAMYTLYSNTELKGQIEHNAKEYVTENLVIDKIAKNMKNTVISILEGPDHDVYNMIKRIISFVCNNYFYDAYSALRHASKLLETIIYDDKDQLPGKEELND